MAEAIRLAHPLPMRATPLLLLSVSACGLFGTPGDDDSAAQEAGPCEEEGEVPGTVTPLADLGTTSEGVAFSSDGRLFVGTPDGIVLVSPDGTVTDAGFVPEAVGLMPYRDGVLVASSDDGFGSGGIYYVDGVAPPSLWAVGLQGPNFLAPSPWGTVLVSSPVFGGIYETNEVGLLTLWSDEVPSPNGMVFDPTGQSLWVVTTFQQEPPLWRVGHDEGFATAAEARWVFPTGTAPDGVAIDAEGGVLILLNLTGEVVRFTEAEGALLFATGLTGPASLAIGRGGAWSRCEAVVTSLYGTTISKVRLAMPGP